MKRFSIPRAVRPVNARVRAVGPRSRSASLCAGEVAASGVSMNAVPSWAAAAPAASTAATPWPVAMPPVATSGRSLTARTSWRSASRPTSPGARSSKEPRWPPASTPWTTSASAPASCAATASAAVVTVTHSAQPAECSASASARDGQPKVTDTTGMRSSRGQGQLLVPAVVVVTRLAELDAVALRLGGERRRVAARARRVRQRRPRARTDSAPNGRSVSRLSSPISARTASALRYPAARKPRPPASDTAAASAGVDGPPAIGAWTIGCSSCENEKLTDQKIRSSRCESVSWVEA